MFLAFMINEIIKEFIFGKNQSISVSIITKRKLIQSIKKFKIDLSPDEKLYIIFKKLMEIVNHTLEKLNKKLDRKRVISIYFLIRKILQEMGNPNYKKIDFRISFQTLKNNKDWWRAYKSTNSFVEKPTNNSH